MDHPCPIHRVRPCPDPELCQLNIAYIKAITNEAITPDQREAADAAYLLRDRSMLGRVIQ